MSDTATLGTIEHIDSAQIEVEPNIRTTVKVDSVFLASIREYGILTPVGCRRNEDGTATLRIGQRRVLAAREVGPTAIPAYIAEGDESTVTRLLEQFVENEHRASLTEPERAAVFQQLAFEGLTVPQIAKRTGVTKTVIEAGITVSGGTRRGSRRDGDDERLVGDRGPVSHDAWRRTLQRCRPTGRGSAPRGRRP
jgi:ParB family transcriptional regulator, chromosome partitioning protein